MKENIKIEQAVKLLEEDRDNYIEASQCGLEYPSDNREHKEKAQAIETILKELERLQEENSQYKRIKDIADNITQREVEEAIKKANKEFIKKDKIREKLEDLEKQYVEALEENSTKAFILKCQMEILKEILEEK